MAKNSDRNRAINAKIDNLTAEEQEQLSDAIRKAKRNIAPNARSTVVEYEQGKLPSSQSQNQLEGQND